MEIICIEGSKIYVFAKDLGTKENVSYNMGTQRVYDYGYMPNEIQNKLMASASELYKQFIGVYATVIPGNKDFLVITPEINENDDMDYLID